MTYEIDANAESIVAIVLQAYRRGEFEGSRAAFDAVELIGNLDDYSPESNPPCCGASEGCSGDACTGYYVSDPYSEALEELALRVGLIEKHYLGTEYRSSGVGTTSESCGCSCAN